jgi:predicted GIY-YIG superfamily endonuclease
MDARIKSGHDEEQRCERSTSTFLRAARTALYTGVTSNLPRRITEHRQSLNEGFTKRHSVK